ncbi:Pre-mRNA-splicing factor cwf19 [Tilletia horrida]|nr:Pre-mRNA-splicing factor cwf19 [Tilletia horrida]
MDSTKRPSDARLKSVADAILSGVGIDQHGRPASSPSASSSADGGSGTTSRAGGMSSAAAAPLRSAFLKPGSQPPTPGAGTGTGTGTGAHTPSTGAPLPPDGIAAQRSSAFRQSGYDNSSKPSTPIPQVFTPQLPREQQRLEASTASGSGSGSGSGSKTGSGKEAVDEAMESMRKRDRAQADADTRPARAVLDSSALNKLQAKVMKAELAGAANAKSLRAKLDAELARAQDASSTSSGSKGGDAAPSFFDVDPKGGGLLPVDDEGQGRGKGKSREVQMLPTLDGHGRLYDVGHGRTSADPADLPGNRRKKRKVETHDPKTGERIRYEDEDEGPTLAELVRQERFAGGAADQKNMDAALAAQISRDGGFKNDVDYMDERADRLARKNMKTDAIKRQFAIQDFARTKKALDTCDYCWQDEGARPPRATVIASGTRTFLALPKYESLVEGHCYINFMKCLMQQAASRKQGVLFCETVTSIRAQRHTYIEAIPVPLDIFQQIPAVFKQSILMSEEEWSQNRKLIDFKERGFRRTMVPQLPYFACQWDYKGFQGYGKIIEGTDADRGEKGGDTFALEETGTGGGEFPRYFATEIIGTLLDLEPRRWRKPRKLSPEQGAERTRAFKAAWSAFDWTKLLDVQEEGGGGGGGGSGSGARR